jgi:hypothetical protein
MVQSPLDYSHIKENEVYYIYFTNIDFQVDHYERNKEKNNYEQYDGCDEEEKEEGDYKRSKLENDNFNYNEWEFPLSFDNNPVSKEEKLIKIKPKSTIKNEPIRKAEEKSKGKGEKQLPIIKEEVVPEVIE